MPRNPQIQEKGFKAEEVLRLWGGWCGDKHEPGLVTPHSIDGLSDLFNDDGVPNYAKEAPKAILCSESQGGVTAIELKQAVADDVKLLYVEKLQFEGWGSNSTRTTDFNLHLRLGTFVCRDKKDWCWRSKEQADHKFGDYTADLCFWIVDQETTLKPKHGDPNFEWWTDRPYLGSLTQEDTYFR